MNPENRKISFGFSKLIKKQNILSHLPKSDKSVELIECLEESEIKVKNAIEKVEKGPLVITIKGNANNLVDRIERESLKKKQIEIRKEEDTRPDSELTVEELAARQLLREARSRLTQEKDTTKVHTLPLGDENIVVEDGQEPTFQDYDNVPISDYGLAMLRGMGWKEGMSIGRNQSKSAKPVEPELRPKGLGLGAQKMVNSNPKDVFDKNGKILILVKGAFAKIITGAHKGTFCEVQGLDEESGRIIVKTSNMNETLTLNELFVIPVTKEEYLLGSKILNNAKYERYKEAANTSQAVIKNEDQGHTHNLNKQSIKTEREDSTDDTKSSERTKKYLSSSSKDHFDKKRSEERLKIKEQKQSTSRNKSNEKKHSSNIERKYSSEDYSLEDDHYSRKKNSKHNKRRDYSSSMSSSSDEDKQQIIMKKNKSKKEIENSSDSEYRSRKSRKECKKNEIKRHSKPKRYSSSDNSESYEKYRNRKR